MTEEKLVIGNVVSLKSGSPAMTVSSVDQYGWIECVYYDQGVIKTTPAIPMSALVIV